MDEIRITAFNSELGTLVAKYGFTAIVAAIRHNDNLWDVTAIGNRRFITHQEMETVNKIITAGLNSVFGNEVEGFQTGIIRAHKDGTTDFDEMPH